MNRFPPALLRSLRNDIPIADLIRLPLALPNSFRDSYLRFLCPLCSGFNTAVNPPTNLARCFSCKKNFNPIDLVMAVRRCSFLDAVKFLQNPALLNRQLCALPDRR